MKCDEFNWQGGRIVRWVLDELDEHKPLASQATMLREDLAMVAYSNQIALDIGWYGEGGTTDGEFMVLVVQDENWDNPLHKVTCADFRKLRNLIARSIQLASSEANHAAKKKRF